MEKVGYVYILSNGFKKLYVGITSDLEGRVWQHKNPDDPRCFTARYGINQLVYFERFGFITSAIAREKEIKGWNRIKKIRLIVSMNPTWEDLSSEWGQPIGPWRDAFEARVPERFKMKGPRPEGETS